MPGNNKCGACYGCAAMGMGPCVSSQQDCMNDTDCNTILKCDMGCKGSTSCETNCFNNNPAGQQLYTTWTTCFCAQCGTPCGC